MIDLPLRDAPEFPSTVATESRPLRDAPTHESRGRSGTIALVGIGMLIIGLLAGFAGGFVVGEEMTPPQPIAVESPRLRPPVPEPPPVAPAVQTIPIPDDAIAAPATEVVPPPTTMPIGPVTVPGSVEFASRPAGATIYMDDARVGITPAVVRDVLPGNHRIRMELPDHRPWTTSVVVDPGGQLRVGASLEAGG